MNKPPAKVWLTPAVRRVGRILLCVGLLAFVVSQVSWDTQVTLRDGRHGHVIDEHPDGTVTVRLSDGAEVDVVPSELGKFEPGLASLLRGLNPYAAVGAFLITLPMAPLAAERLRRLLAATRAALPAARVVSVTYFSYLVSLVALGGLGGDVYRAAALRRTAGIWRPVLAALFLDRFAGLFALLTFPVLAAPFFLRDPEFGLLARWTLIVAGSGAVVGLIVLRLGGLRLIQRWLEHQPGADAAYPRLLLDTIWTIVRDAPTRGSVACISLLMQVVNLGSVVLVGHALGVDQALETSLLVIPLAMVISVLTPTPQGLGAMEGLLVVLLGPHVAGGANTCLLYALGIRVARLGWSVPGFVLLMCGGGGAEAWVRDREAAVQMAHEPAYPAVDDGGVPSSDSPF